MAVLNDVFNGPSGAIVPEHWSMGSLDYGSICKVVAERYCPDAMGVARVVVSTGGMNEPSLDFVFKVAAPPERTCKAVYALRELIDDPFKQKVIEAAVPDLYAKVKALMATIDTTASPTVNVRVHKYDLINLVKKESYERNRPTRFDHFYQSDRTILDRKIQFSADSAADAGIFGKDYPGLRGPRSR